MKPLSFSRARFAILACLVLGAVALVLASYAENVMAAKGVSQTSLSAPEFVFGPEVFVRGEDKLEEIREFSIQGFVGPFILHADHGASEATDENSPIVRFGSTVSLNEKKVLMGKDFKDTGPVIRIEVDLEDPSTLVVKLPRKGADELTIWIEGTKGAEVDPFGATVTDPDGVWELDFPNGAVNSPLTTDHRSEGSVSICAGFQHYPRPGSEPAYHPSLLKSAPGSAMGGKKAHSG